MSDIPTPTVERARVDDIPAWLELAAEVGDLFGADMASDPGFRGTLQRNIGRGAALCVRIDGHLAGGMLFRESTINWLAVGRAYRRGGIGRALVGYALEVGSARVRVTTFGADHPHPEAGAARHLYRAMGFAPSPEPPELASDGTSREVLVWTRP
jgi:ribosomal protein S18 acetylase RimI-like enzyme